MGQKSGSVKEPAKQVVKEIRPPMFSERRDWTVERPTPRTSQPGGGERPIEIKR
jgi:hypothetical protein